MMKKILLTCALLLISANTSAQEQASLPVKKCGTNCSYTLDSNGKAVVWPTVAGQESWVSLPNRTDIVELEIKDGVSLVTYSFSGCSNLQKVTLPKTLTDIPLRTFLGTSSLTSLTLPSNLKTIDGRVFEDSAIQHLEVPASVTSLDSYSFWSPSLETLILPASITSVTNKSLSYMPTTTKVFCASQTVEDLLTSTDKSHKDIYTYKQNTDGSIIISQKGQDLSKFTDKANMLSGTWSERYEYEWDSKYGAYRQYSYGTEDDQTPLNSKIYMPDGTILLFAKGKNGKFVNKLHAKIYTVEEAEAVTENGDKFRVRLTYK